MHSLHVDSRRVQRAEEEDKAPVSSTHKTDFPAISLDISLSMGQNIQQKQFEKKYSFGLILVVQA